MQLRGAGDRNDPRLLSEQPGKGDLSRCGLLLLRDLANQINKGLVRLSSLWREAGKLVTEVGAVKRRVLVDRTRKEAFAQGTERDEPDPKFLKRRQHLFLRLAPPQGIFALNRSDRLDGVCTTDRMHARLREAEVLDLTFLDQALHRAGDVFNRNVWVDAMLIEQIDDVLF